MLDREQVEYCRREGIALAYDCAQIGWITQACADEEAENSRPLEGTSPKPAGPVGSQAATADLLRSLARDAERLLAPVSGDRSSLAGAERQLQSAAVAAAERLAEEYDPQSVDLAHWALHAFVARRVGAIRGQLHEVPRASKGAAFSFRAWSQDDAQVYLRLLANPKVWEYLPEPFPSPFDEDTARTLIEVASFSFHHETKAVEVDGRPIGQCLLRLDRPFAGTRAAEVAYWLGEEYWGQGWMSRILPAFTYHGFTNHPVDVIYAWILPANQASIRLVERVGYRRDPFPLEARIAQDLQRPGFVRYASYRSEWPVAARAGSTEPEQSISDSRREAGATRRPPGANR